MYKRDLLQMLHTAFQIQEEFEIPEFKSMWHFVAGQEMEKMVKPTFGHWGSVGQTGETFLKSKKLLFAIIKRFLEESKAKKKINLT